jgi:hypothetical protein
LGTVDPEKYGHCRTGGKTEKLSMHGVMRKRESFSFIKGSEDGA